MGKDKHAPFTSDYSKVHTSRDHPYEHVDQYSWGKGGEKAGEIHGISVKDHPGLAGLSRGGEKNSDKSGGGGSGK